MRKGKVTKYFLEHKAIISLAFIALIVLLTLSTFAFYNHKEENPIIDNNLTQLSAVGTISGQSIVIKSQTDAPCFIRVKLSYSDDETDKYATLLSNYIQQTSSTSAYGWIFNDGFYYLIDKATNNMLTVSSSTVAYNFTTSYASPTLNSFRLINGGSYSVANSGDFVVSAVSLKINAEAISAYKISEMTIENAKQSFNNAQRTNQKYGIVLFQYNNKIEANVVNRNTMVELPKGTGLRFELNGEEYVESSVRADGYTLIVDMQN